MALKKAFATDIKINGQVIQAEYVRIRPVGGVWISGGLSPIMGNIPLRIDITYDVFQNETAAKIDNAPPLISGKNFIKTLTPEMAAKIDANDHKRTGYLMLKYAEELAGAEDLV